MTFRPGNSQRTARPAQNRSAGDNERAGLDAFNGLADDAARHALLSCCSATRWAAAVAEGRPYLSLSELLSESDVAGAALTEADLRAALAGHPRLGDQPAAPATQPVGAASSRPTSSGDGMGWSRQEQAGVSTAGPDTLRALAAGNAGYERQFGHIYLACATGRNAADLLTFLPDRLNNDRDAEWRVVAAELAKINRIRLGKLLAGLADQADSADRAEPS
jgi:2-oxo-4-hydroxy-4-carboxy-5-ureidoimidazoline decarboxylase